MQSPDHALHPCSVSFRTNDRVSKHDNLNLHDLDIVEQSAFESKISCRGSLKCLEMNLTFAKLVYINLYFLRIDLATLKHRLYVQSKK